MDPSKLPDVAGIHVGIPAAEIPELLKKVHPNVTITPDTPERIRAVGITPPDKMDTRLRAYTYLNPAKTAIDQFTVDYTTTPNKPAVYAITRSYTYPEPIDHQNLINALRQKYGKEIMSNGNGATDDLIANLFWLFDEQGRPIPKGPVTNSYGGFPYGCAIDATTEAVIGIVQQYLNKVLPPANFCDSVVFVSVSFGVNATVKGTITTIVDKPLERRAGLATGEWARAWAQQQEQRQLDQSKQAKPTL